MHKILQLLFHAESIKWTAKSIVSWSKLKEIRARVLFAIPITLKKHSKSIIITWLHNLEHSIDFYFLQKDDITSCFSHGSSLKSLESSQDESDFFSLESSRSLLFYRECWLESSRSTFFLLESSHESNIIVLILNYSYNV